LVYRDLKSQASFARRVHDEIGSIPSVAQVAAVTTVPLEVEWNNAEAVREGDENRPIGELPVVVWPSVSSEYFAAMEIPLIAGRTFRDDGEREPVAILSATAARVLWPGQDPIGRKLRHWFSPKSAWLRVIGVVGDVRSFGLDQQASPSIYRPYFQRGGTEFSVIVRTGLTPDRLQQQIREAVWKVDRGVPVRALHPLSGLVSRSLDSRRLQTSLMIAFAGIAALVAGVGVYGVTAYSVIQRRREIAIRLALGADRTKVRALIFRSGMMPVVIGLSIGVAAAASLSRVVASLLFEVSAAVPVVFAATPLALAAAGALPCLWACRRAVRTDPALVLQGE
jgi:putative ABC transport system permease protein